MQHCEIIVLINLGNRKPGLSSHTLATLAKGVACKTTEALGMRSKCHFSNFFLVISNFFGNF